MRRLPVLCPQEYVGVAEMRAVPCNRCTAGWGREEQRCTISVGCEHLPTVEPREVPDCPIQDRCQHQAQSEGPCSVRARGMICESALVLAGIPDQDAHPLAFNAQLA